MKNQPHQGMDYIRRLRTSSSRDQVFAALTSGISGWWSTIAGAAKNKGDVFRVSFGPDSYWEFEVLAIDKPEMIIWQCVLSHQDHNLKGIDAEWLDSKIQWRIISVDDQVEIELFHKGLETTGICYDVCSKAWDFYLLESLKNYLETGRGNPGED